MSALQSAKLFLAPLGWRLLSGTLRLDPPVPPPTAGGVIFACLHRDILPALIYVRSLRPALVVSNSPDGDILVRTLGHENYAFVRGESGEDGRRAFVHLRRLVEGGAHAGLAVDGPRGPFGFIHEGVLQLARFTGRPIVPLGFLCGMAASLNTWDRTVVPWPGSRVKVLQAPPVHVPRDATSQELAVTRELLATWFAGEAEATS